MVSFLVSQELALDSFGLAVALSGLGKSRLVSQPLTLASLGLISDFAISRSRRISLPASQSLALDPRFRNMSPQLRRTPSDPSTPRLALVQSRNISPGLVRSRSQPRDISPWLLSLSLDTIPPSLESSPPD